MQVVVGKVEPRLTAFGPGSRHLALLGLEEEGRDLDGSPGKHRPRHGVKIAPEPAVGLRTVVGDEKWLASREAHDPGDRDQVFDLSLGARRAILQGIGHETPIDQDGLAISRLERSDDMPAPLPSEMANRYRSLP